MCIDGIAHYNSILLSTIIWQSVLEKWYDLVLTRAKVYVFLDVFEVFAELCVSLRW